MWRRSTASGSVQETSRGVDALGGAVDRAERPPLDDLSPFGEFYGDVGRVDRDAVVNGEVLKA